MKTEEAKQKAINIVGDTAFRFNLLLDDIEKYYNNGCKKDGWETCKSLKKIIDTLEIVKCEIAIECGYQGKKDRYLHYVSSDGDKRISKNVNVKDLSYLNIDMVIISHRLKDVIIIIDDLCIEHNIKFYISAGYIPSNNGTHKIGRAIDIVVDVDYNWFIKIAQARLEDKGIKGKIKNCSKYIHIECYKTDTKITDFIIIDKIKSDYINCVNKKRGFEHLIPIGSS